MRTVLIPKKSGGTRKIYIPNKDEIITYRSYVSEIQNKAHQLDKDNNVMHGFIPGRSPVTMAMQHINYKWTISFDIKDFFDNVNKTKLICKLKKEIINTVLVDGIAGQGLPTSPGVANIAAHTMDNAILSFIKKNSLSVVYTRYADDLTFSGNDNESKQKILTNLPEIITRCGWKINNTKTYVQDSKHGRRHICGIAVDDFGIYPTRRQKRRLRAATHKALLFNDNKAKLHAAGLSEYCKLKPPREKINLHIQEEFEKLCNLWKINKSYLKETNFDFKELRDDDFIITSDPVYILGCSTWTTGWKSCLAWPNGSKRRGALVWCQAPGTRLAALLSNKTKEIAGVTRRVMRARVWVHAFRNGQIAYDKIYGDFESIQELKDKLESIGVIPIADVSKNEKVIGNIKTTNSLYLDSLKARKVLLKNNKNAWILIKP